MLQYKQLQLKLKLNKMDCKLEFNEDLKAYDVIWENGDLKTDNGMLAFIITSLFTRRDYGIFKKDWVGNIFSTYKMGSDLEGLVEQSAVLPKLLIQIRDEVLRALEWLKTEGIATNITCYVLVQSINTIKINIEIDNENFEVQI